MPKTSSALQVLTVDSPASAPEDLLARGALRTTHRWPAADYPRNAAVDPATARGPRRSRGLCPRALRAASVAHVGAEVPDRSMRTRTSSPEMEERRDPRTARRACVDWRRPRFARTSMDPDRRHGRTFEWLALVGDLDLPDVGSERQCSRDGPSPRRARRTHRHEAGRQQKTRLVYRPHGRPSTTSRVGAPPPRRDAPQPPRAISIRRQGRAGIGPGARAADRAQSVEAGATPAKATARSPLTVVRRRRPELGNLRARTTRSRAIGALDAGGPQLTSHCGSDEGAAQSATEGRCHDGRGAALAAFSSGRPLKARSGG